MINRTLKMLAACCAVVASCPAAADTANPLTGFYYGTANIAQPASIGTVDLAFYLDVTGTAIQKATSFVDLDKTLLFPAVPPTIPAVNGKAVGPRVSGYLSQTDFTLTSHDPFQTQVSGKTVTRRLSLGTATVRDGGASLSGTYTETVTGLTANTLTITGPFLLVKPMPVTTASGADRNSDGCLDLNEIRAGGSDPTAIEFSDLSAALNLFHGSNPNLRVGDPPGPNCTNAEQRLQEALRAYQAGQP
ncbi:hypothetical protein [uncultured Lamprocystis sp.]|jgi:hypothetical protein|uniref:hypothetical protein n=1 Tax=uncultured Lamprocystis sp. TaxID=543132 RepID=UPI0025E1B4A0|nr:hypothetical protein [uncultured Lamprocystis sp.]